MLERVKSGFYKTFGRRAEHVFSAPGRTEIGGNHTDHERGKVIAGAVNLRTVAAVAENGERTIRILSEGYPVCEVSLDRLTPDESEFGTTASIIRGVAAAFRDRGCELRGFDAYAASNVLSGSGLSSSAAFEVLIGNIINGLFFGGKCDPVEIAQIGQYAENVFFGKPCGLMDQMASSVGNIVYIDFNDPEAPAVKKLDFDLAAAGYKLCIIDTGADHAALTDEYAAITDEMKAVSAVFGKDVLREVDEAEYYGRITEVRKTAGDRAALRAMHIFEENKRVEREVEALGRGDFNEFLSVVNESGRSSWLYLQNVVPTGATEHQEVAFALALAARLLGNRGASRVHGGGFAGTIQAFVPDDMLDGFKAEMERVLGEGRCHVLSISPTGGNMDE
ncbi:MAG: galactokinase [Oscillospiraceae bacterium]|nr:galactokinase [Oscillospiraceae bacterium]